MAASKSASPGLSRNGERVDTANVTSGRIAKDAYMRQPMASLYGIRFMRVASSGFKGTSFLLYVAPGVIGVLTNLASEVETTKDGLNISHLRHGDNACSTATSDFDAEEPVDGSQVGERVLLKLLLVSSMISHKLSVRAQSSMWVARMT